MTESPERSIFAWQRALARLAVVAAIYSLLLTGVLVSHAVRIHAANPFTSPKLKDLKAQIAHKGNEALIADYRQLDAEYNARYFAARSAVLRGIPLLAVGIALFLLAGLASLLLHRASIDPTTLPTPQPNRLAMTGRYAVGACGLILAGILVGLAALPPPLVPPLTAPTGATTPIANGQPTATPPDTPPTPPVIVPNPPINPGNPVNPVKPTTPTHPVMPSAAGMTAVLTHIPPENAQNWPFFRGPAGVGIANTADAPMQWDVKTGKGIRWKSPVPLPGNNSPIVWGNNVFVAGADVKHREVYCFDADTGKLRWRGDLKGIAGSTDIVSLGNPENSFTAPTLATNGQQVVAIFANGDAAGFNFSGKRLWAHNYGPFESQYGYAASLTMYKQLAIFQLDQGSNADQGLSELLALDAGTGKTAWRVKQRPVPNSWSSPIIIPTTTRDELITCGKPWVIAYNPATGVELWRANCLDGDIASSPAYGGGLLIVSKPYQAFIALKPGGSGEVSQSAIAWQSEDNAPDTTSLAANDELLFSTSNSTLLCIDIKTGKKLWDFDLAGNTYASPIIAGDRVYLVTERGIVQILAAARTCKPLGKVEMNDDIMATPAFVGKCLYLRSDKYLYCIGGGA